MSQEMERRNETETGSAAAAAAAAAVHFAAAVHQYSVHRWNHIN
jgi:hypothetical protein